MRPEAATGWGGESRLPRRRGWCAGQDARTDTFHRTPHLSHLSRRSWLEGVRPPVPGRTKQRRVGKRLIGSGFKVASASPVATPRDPPAPRHQEGKASPPWRPQPAGPRPELHSRPSPAFLWEPEGPRGSPGEAAPRWAVTTVPAAKSAHVAATASQNQSSPSVV